jgi:hypothetical protein
VAGPSLALCPEDTINEVFVAHAAPSATYSDTAIRHAAITAS